MITYGSYWQADQNIPMKTILIMFSDLIVSLLAGLAIFPAAYAFGFEPTAGPSLLFITIPAIFASMPMGQVFMVLFFILTAFAANGAMLSLIEVPVAFLSERYNFSRLKATLLTAGLLAVIGSTSALSGSTLAEVKPFGKTMFDMFDYLRSNIM
jgi:NSS family neurotransmitter:Na+ symporter